MVVTWTYNAGTNTATASGAGSTNFAALIAADTAGGWGKFTADATGTQIQVAGKIIIDNGVLFEDSQKQIILVATAITSSGQSFFRVLSGGTLTLGVLISVSEKTSFKGISFLDFSNTDYHDIIRGDSGSIIYLYSSKFAHALTSASIVEIRVYGTRVWNCTFDYNVELFNSLTSDIYNVLLEKSDFSIVLANPVTTNIEKFTTLNPQRYVYWQTTGSTIKGLYGRGYLNIPFRVQNLAADGKCYLINADVDTWAFNWTGSASTATVYRQYEFDLQVIDNAESYSTGALVPIEGLGVTILDKDYNEVYSGTTDVDGEIPTQTLSMGYYNQANGNTIQMIGPYFLLIDGGGEFEDYMTEIDLTHPITHQASMVRPAVPANLATAEPADVLTDKTFFGKAGTQETGTANFGGGGYLYIDRPVVKEVLVEKINPVNIDLLKLTGNLLKQKQILKHKLIEGEIKP